MEKVAISLHPNVELELFWWKGIIKQVILGKARESYTLPLEVVPYAASRPTPETFLSPY